MNIKWTHNRLNPDADTLVLLVHGMNCWADTLSTLIARLHQELPTAELLIPSVPFRWYRRFDLEEACSEMAGYIAEALRGRPVTTLILAGHSAGGVLVQSVYLNLLTHPRATALPQTRLVLIAPLTRGWSMSHHVPPGEKLRWLVGLRLLRLLDLGFWTAGKLRGKPYPELWIRQLQRGAPFVVGLRLRWLQSGRKPAAITILLGSVDEIVSWRDMVDEVLDGDHVRYAEVPHSNHVQIVDLEEGNDSDDRRGEARWPIIREAFLGQTPPSIRPWDDDPPKRDPRVKRVVFVIHGIRDEGHWTQKIGSRARRLFVEAGGAREAIAVQTSSYGYFSMLEFLNPGARQQKIHWLMDAYVEARRRYPEAEFSYISHSNGTYLLAQALLDYKEVTFDRIAFAGSVVSTRYDWPSLLARGRVHHVLNFTAAGDWVVSLFPRFAQIFPPIRLLVGKNLGGAGVLDFTSLPRPESSTPHLDGAHSAALAEWNWDNLARFAVALPAPVIPPRTGKAFKQHQSLPFRPFLGTVVTPLAIVIILGVVYGLGRLAWLNPALFWLVPLGLLVLTAITFSAWRTRSDGRTFAARRPILKLANGILVAGGAGILIWWLAALSVQLTDFGWLHPGVSSSAKALRQIWEHDLRPSDLAHRAALGMASVIGYVLGLIRILTRV